MATIKQKDIKLLWSRAGGICSMCKCQLSTESRQGNIYAIGEQAHIVGEKENAARGISDLTLDERNSYFNLILLCPNCHTKIDNSSEYYTVERLHRIKSEHELTVQESLRQFNPNTKADEEFYNHIINSAVKMCYLENWKNWISNLCSTELTMNKEVLNNLCDFTSLIQSANFRNVHSEIENSVITFNYILHNLLSIYTKNAKEDDRGFYYSNRFYKNEGRFNPHYDRDLEQYNRWDDLVTNLCFELTKAANWFAEAVRSEFDPLFFNISGKFKIIYGPDMNLQYKEIIPEFTTQEKQSLPSSYIQKSW